MLTETALMGIACLWIGATEVEREAMLVNLSQEEKTVLEEMVTAKLCVPDRLREILSAGREEAVRGEARDANSRSEPTFRT